MKSGRPRLDSRTGIDPQAAEFSRFFCNYCNREFSSPNRTYQHLESCEKRKRAGRIAKAA